MSTSIQTIYFAANLAQAKSRRGHDECNSSMYSAYQSNLTQYRTRHVKRECNCSPLIVDREDLAKILGNGHLPLLRINRGKLMDDLSVDVILSRYTPRYIALSHVWADGLGNPYQNALPQCQLSSLVDILEKLRPMLDLPDTEEVLLWCDTLCCPAEAGEAKSIALKQMKRTYLEACCVLVLENSLRTFDVREAGNNEIAIRIATSGWMRRLWTFQEAALSLENSRLWFCFKESFINIQTLLLAIFAEFSILSHRGLQSISKLA